MNDLQTLRKRYIENIFVRSINRGEITELIDGQAADGSWPGIDYGDTSRANWQTMRHLGHLKKLSIAWADPQSPLQHDDSVKRAALAALDFWLENDFRNPNWWFNEIGAPRELSDILLLLDSELTPEQRQKGIEILSRAKLAMTGQNLVWMAEITAKRGILQGDPALVARAFERIGQEIRLAPRDDEGVQADYSFHQHGPCLYNHGYGAGFAGDCSRMAHFLRGTSFAFSEEKITLLVNYLLDGSQWMARGRNPDYGADGREITRKDDSAWYLVPAAENLAAVADQRGDELLALAARIRGDDAPQLSGNRYFWCSDMMTHHRPGYYFSARMHSTRLVNTDMPCNEEGLLSHHIADGCTFIMRSGNEYYDIFPVWDWQKIPGATVAQKPALKGDPRRQGATDFVGGVSDGHYGAAAFDFRRPEDGLSARKAWFFFDGVIVCLGSGISCKQDLPVVTTLNQCHLDGPVRVGGVDGERDMPEGRHSLTDISWVWHGGIGYVFATPAAVELADQQVQGTWWHINHKYSKEPVRQKTFTLWLDHGNMPENAQYAYFILPDTDAARAADFAATPSVVILANTPSLQAVRHIDLHVTQAVFYQPGELQFDAEKTLTAEAPCIVMVREDGNSLEFSVSDPTQKRQTLALRLSGRFKGEGAQWLAAEGCTRITVELPQGMDGGKTASIELQHLE